MKLSQINKTIISPVSWSDIPYGAYYRQTLEISLKTWWPKLFGFYLLKIGALSADLNTSDCDISHQINVGSEGKYLHVIADPCQLPFANKSADACLLAHTLSYTIDPYGLLQEIDRVLIDDGWLIITTFNPVSILGLGKICPVLFHRQPYRSRMYTHMRLLGWLGMLNFEVLHCNNLQALPWQRKGRQLLSIHFSVIGCLSVIVARKRMFPINLTLIKNKVFTLEMGRPANATTRSC